MSRKHRGARARVRKFRRSLMTRVKFEGENNAPPSAKKWQRLTQKASS